eukprot:GEMP01061468.1.p1 GENE.GEMP01061468.1~~GEMP01061468.1.p1  ORF type:complete len:264 (+),score=54.97 GEMP01061468.1:415-1206(+)
MDEVLVRRFFSKHMSCTQDRFQCMLCPMSGGFEKRLDSEAHIRLEHMEELYEFCHQHKAPRKKPVQKKQKVTSGFSIEAVLGKNYDRKTKKVQPPALASSSIPVTKKKAYEPQIANDDLDETIFLQLQDKFLGLGVLYVDVKTSRCQLCRARFATLSEAKDHCMTAHEKEYEKEMENWHRFVHHSINRLGNTCHVCQREGFSCPEDVAHHIGVQVWIAKNDAHITAYASKLRSIQLAVDEQCCGDGLVSRGPAPTDSGDESDS